jgi:N-acetylmuramoyl-L-alanine amidase
MRRLIRSNLAVNIAVYVLVFGLAAQPTLNAPGEEAAHSRGPRSLVESLFYHATDLGRSLHSRPLEERSIDDYLRALDAYGRVIRLNTDSFFSAEALSQMAALQREMADASGDSALYQQAIETFRRIVVEHPQSGFAGDALVSIAQVYEENLQDLDGAASAYRELIGYFPSSVMAREATAILARFEAQLGSRPVDVEAPARALAASDVAIEALGGARLTNVRNFSGPDYARVVIDLSNQIAYTGERVGSARLSIQLDRARVSPSLYGRRFIVGESTLLERITVSEKDPSSGVRVDIDVSSLSDYSTFHLANPNRLVIDIHAAGSLARSRKLIEAASHDHTLGEATVGAGATGGLEASSGRTSPGRRSPVDKQATILSLPDITDPILPLGPAASHPSTGAAGAAVTTTDARSSASAPVKCVVIDPGHGGHDTGTIGTNGMREKDLVLDVARRLRNYIKRNYPEVEVILTRDSDRYVALEERTAIANSRRADLFISVHANASPSRAASGVETYFLSPDRATSEDLQTAARENAKLGGASQTEPKDSKPGPVFASVTVGNRVAQSRELARYIQSGLVRGIGAASPRTASNRGVKHAPFVVLLGAAMPSVLAEVSFMSNPRDEALLQTAEFRDRIAASLFAGLNAYLRKARSTETKAK